MHAYVHVAGPCRSMYLAELACVAPTPVRLAPRCTVTVTHFLSSVNSIEERTVGATRRNHACNSQELRVRKCEQLHIANYLEARRGGESKSAEHGGGSHHEQACPAVQNLTRELARQGTTRASKQTQHRLDSDCAVHTAQPRLGCHVRGGFSRMPGSPRLPEHSDARSRVSRHRQDRHCRQPRAGILQRRWGAYHGTAPMDCVLRP